jgi:hypothetical protein
MNKLWLELYNFAVKSMYLPCCNVVRCGKSPQTFQRNVMPPSLGLQNKLSKKPPISNHLLVAGFLPGFLFNTKDGASAFLGTLMDFFY